MKIALVVPGGVDRTGEYRVIPAVLALIKRLSLRNEVHVFALRQESRPATWDLLGARIHNIGERHTRWRAIRAIRAENRVSRFQLVHALWSGSPGFIAVAAARLLGIPSIIHLAGGELVALAQIGFGGRLTWRGRLREAVLLRAATAITAASDSMIDTLSGLGIAARRIPLGVDLGVWPPREPVKRAAAEPARLIHVASLNRVKDQATLLRALAQLAGHGLAFGMDIVGEDTLGGEVQRLAQELGLGTRVRFLGFLTQSQLRPLMETAHLSVISSRHEAGPLVVLEAAVAGVPTVGTAVGHIAEWAPRAARAVPVGDSAALADAINAVLSTEDLRLEIAREALIRATREDADFTAHAFENLYRVLTDDASETAET